MRGACGTYGEHRDPYRIMWRNHEGESHCEDLGVDGRIILKYIFIKENGVWPALFGSKYGKVTGCCENVGEHFESRKMPKVS